MTQRRRLDAFLLDAARAAGRRGARRDDDRRARARARGRRDRRRRRATARRAQRSGSTPKIVHGVAYEGNVPYGVVDRARYARRAVVELGDVPGGYGWVFAEGRPRQRRRRRVADRRAADPRAPRARLCEAHGLDPAAARAAARPPAADAPARSSRRPRARALLVGDAAGLIDPVSGDGMYECFVSARLAAEAVARSARRPRDRPRALRRPPSRAALGPLHRASLAAQARVRPLAARVLRADAQPRRLAEHRAPPARASSRHPGDARGVARIPLARRWSCSASLKNSRHPCRQVVEMDLNDLLRRAVDARRVRHPPEARPPARCCAATALSPRSKAPRRSTTRISTRTCARSRRSPRSATTSSTRAATSTSPTRRRTCRASASTRSASAAHVSFAFRVIPKNVPRFEELGLPPGVQEPRRGAPRPRPRHRRDRLGQDDDARGDDRLHQPHAAAAHRHDRGPDRDPAPGSPVIVNQREVGLDTENFGQALRRALRQDPDMILIGELRDAETAQTALQAAESGHLVLSTLHTVDAAETVGRMIEFFPPRSSRSDPLDHGRRPARRRSRQRLLPRVGGGRVAAVEVMVNNARIADLIRENKRRRDHRRGRRGRLLPHADLPAGADRASARGRGRPRGRRQRIDEPPRLPRRARVRARRRTRCRHRPERSAAASALQRAGAASRSPSPSSPCGSAPLGE